MIDANIGNPATATERPCELQPGLNRLWWDLKTDRSSEIHLRTPPLYVPDFRWGRRAGGLRPSCDP
jgi:hypothetical protein